MRKPLISIVLPAFNGERYLEESVESVIGQTEERWELIIVDDASSDATSEIANRFAQSDARISCYRNKTNLRLPASLNRGFEHAVGRYLTWTSDDNLYHPDALRSMSEKLDSDPDVDIVCTDDYLIDATGATIRRRERQPYHYLPICNTVAASFLYRRQVHEDLGGYAEDLFLLEDYDFWLRAARKFRFARIPDPLYYYRVHDESLTNVRYKECQLLAIKVLRRNILWVRNLPLRWRQQAAYHLAVRAFQMRCYFTSFLFGLLAPIYHPPEFVKLAVRRVLRRRGSASGEPGGGPSEP